jgi:hypothetical protein
VHQTEKCRDQKNKDIPIDTGFHQGDQIIGILSFVKQLLFSKFGFLIGFVGD